ncbi:MAG: hypothetical protein KA974_07635 [Saprospiraceae bacterium]|nr:hypothetical protein [Saprospiraceae bacterium]MBP7699262.1 hypothetical protein [Saprospiraceae bacterium]
MKKLFAVLFITSSIVFSAKGQQLYVDVFSGYNKTAFDDKTYQPHVGYVPIGGRIGGGLEHVQLGVEYSRDITHATFNYKIGDQTVSKDIFNNDYVGLFLRGNLSSLPAYRFGLIIMAGAGYYNTKVENYGTVPSDILVKSTTYPKTLGYNGRVGISVPIYAQLHWEFGYQINYVKREAYEGLPAYKGLYHSFQGGLSLNLVFGNTEKRCRRVIDSDGGFW